MKKCVNVSRLLHILLQDAYKVFPMVCVQTMILHVLIFRVYMSHFVIKFWILCLKSYLNISIATHLTWYYWKGCRTNFYLLISYYMFSFQWIIIYHKFPTTVHMHMKICSANVKTIFRMLIRIMASEQLTVINTDNLFICTDQLSWHHITYFSSTVKITFGSAITSVQLSSCSVTKY